MPPRKRKKSNILPGSADKGTKEKMADNTTAQGTPQGTPQGGHYILPPVPPMPPMYPQTPTGYYMNMTSPVMNQQTTSNDVLQSILSRLDKMDAKLNRLDAIQASVSKITDRLNTMDTKITEIEKGQKFVSEQYDALLSKTKSTDHNIGEMREEVKKLKEQNSKLKASNDSLADDVIDLKCRSMRDNLLFFGVTEHTRSPESAMDTGLTSGTHTHSPEDCAELVFDFCKDVLKIEDPKSKISIDRAHRIGRFNAGKVRPIVAKFKDTASKACVQNALKTVNLRGSPYNVSEQYPPEVKDRRKELIPIMLQARRDGKKAVLVRDKLFINSVLYSQDPSITK